LGAAHAGCFAMALSLILGEAGFTHVTVRPQEGGFKITGSHIVFTDPHWTRRMMATYFFVVGSLSR
jgi:organic hydroperoxide reductase OsmC/OhrA